MYPGDIGTNGGLSTNEYAQVLDAAGDPIPGLYACGNRQPPSWVTRIRRPAPRSGRA